MRISKGQMKMHKHKLDALEHKTGDRKSYGAMRQAGRSCNCAGSAVAQV